MEEVLTRHWESLNDAGAAIQTKALKRIDASTRRMTFVVALLLPVLVLATLLGLEDPLLANLVKPVAVGIGLAVSLIIAIILILTARKR